MGKNGKAQVSGSLFMLRDNFYAQMQNPSYMRGDELTVISMPGFSGLSFGNTGNFKISDLIVATETGNPVVDFEHFYLNANNSNNIGQNLSVPLLYFATPVKNGMISFFYRENISLSTKFGIEPFEFLLNGNFPGNFRSFNTKKLNFFLMGYREFAFGYSRNWSENVNIGARAKVLFGGAFANLQDWNFSLETSPTGDEVHLYSDGGGRIFSPVPFVITEIGKISEVNGDNALGKYLGTFYNPGLAIDFGITWQYDDRHTFSFAARDLGGIWFRKNGMDIYQNGNYKFTGFDIASSIRYQHQNGLISPSLLMIIEKENIRDVYRPSLDTASFVAGLPTKAALHYEFRFSEKLSFGITNQSVFQQYYFSNILSVGALHQAGKFAFFENLNFYGIKNISVGAGFQYEGRYAQIFMATDNLLAFYHPANNKIFSLSFGVSLILNREKEPEMAKSGNGRGKEGNTSKNLPFYRNKN